MAQIETESPMSNGYSRKMWGPLFTVVGVEEKSIVGADYGLRVSVVLGHNVGTTMGSELGV